ncbi:MAG: PspA/IM30 family protein [Halieaceae bacterium]|jgi:phage shock protein A|nr:PspA/IM30 family protein [Halieaceae bacterium]
MSVFDKLNTLFRAGIRESVEQVTDANAVRIYRQEIVEAEALLAQRRDALAATIATRRELEEEIARLERRIAQREEQLKRLPAGERTDSLLEMAAREIAGFETELEVAKRRHVETCKLISSEESTLRKLLAETREHRREIKLLAAQVQRQRVGTPAGQTVAGRLAALRETRAAITGTVHQGDHLEAGMEEALARVNDSPLDRALADAGRDDAGAHLQSVLARLSGLGAAS